MPTRMKNYSIVFSEKINSRKEASNQKARGGR